MNCGPASRKLCQAPETFGSRSELELVAPMTVCVTLWHAHST
jgi:hypothetical protein